MSLPHEPGTRARPRPVLRFLGEDEASGGPFALLGLNPNACTEDLILSALDRQVERIDRHPECDTPEADEVRLALHAAAAQLLDPSVRRHLIAKWTGQPQTPKPAPPRAAPAAAPGPRLAGASLKLLEADAILALGMFGGWNQRSLRRLLSLARARGFSTAQVAQTLTNLSKRRRAPKPAPRPAPPRRQARSREEFQALEGAARPQPAAPPRVAPPSAPAPEEIDPAYTLVRNALIFGGVGLTALAAALVLILVLTAKPTTPTAPPAPAAPVATAPTGAAIEPTPPPPPAAEPKPAPKPPPTGQIEPAAIKRELDACAQAAQTEPAEAITRFERAVQSLALSWPLVPADQQVACQDAIVEFMYKSVASPDVTLRAIAAIGAGADALASGELMLREHILPAAWSSGMLVRLVRERDLSAAARATIDTRIARSLGQSRPAMEQTFEAGVSAALGLIPAHLTPPASQADAAMDLDAWKDWTAGVDALTGNDVAAKNRLLLAALESLLVSAPEPNTNRSVADAIGDLTLRITWRPADESRRWLLRWFADARVSPADLHAVTSSLATKSSAAGVDLTMVLSTSASEKNRADLRDRFAAVWNLSDSVTRDDLTIAWAKAAHEALNKSFASADDAEELASTVTLARLNEAANWQWRGDGGEAAKLVADLLPPVEAALVPTNTGPQAVRHELSDGAWAERYLNARQNLKVKRDLIEQLSGPGGPAELGAPDAEVLVGEAIAGSSAEVRSAALEAVKRFSDNPSIINGMIERLPRMPRNGSTSALIEFLAQRQLPPSRDAEWPIVARRILVERLLEAIAAESSRARIDRLSTLLALSYRSMASAAPLPADQRALKAQPPADRSAAQVWERWRTAAESILLTTPAPIPLDQIDRRRAGRLGQARGMVQAFAGQQASLCEILAYTVNAENPSKADQVKLVLSQLGEERRRATSVLHQLNVSERAMTQLWLIRFKEDPTGGSPTQ